MCVDSFVQGESQFLQKKECCAGALEGRLIATLCRLSGAKTVLEVGMFTGTTTLAIAEAIPADGKVTLAAPYPIHLSRNKWIFLHFLGNYKVDNLPGVRGLLVCNHVKNGIG